MKSKSAGGWESKQPTYRRLSGLPCPNSVVRSDSVVVRSVATPTSAAFGPVKLLRIAGYACALVFVIWFAITVGPVGPKMYALIMLEYGSSPSPWRAVKAESASIWKRVAVGSL